MRKSLRRSAFLKSALAFSLLSAAAPLDAGKAQPEADAIADYDRRLYPETGGFPDPDRLRIRYGDPLDYGTQLRVYRERQEEARRAEAERREAEWEREEAAARERARETRSYRAARRAYRRAEREFHRALALGDRTVIVYARGRLNNARRALRRARRAG